MEQFRNVLEYCGLSDLGFKGSKFTWSNRHQDGSFMKERLDRAMANYAWCELFMRREILVLPSRTSNHCLLLVRIFDAHQSPRRSHLHRSFKFEASWLVDENYMTVIKDAWVTCDDRANGILLARERLEQCQ
jgi:hypothetical protein